MLNGRMEETKVPVNILSQLVKSEPAAFSVLKTGDIVEGIILEQGANMLVVDLGKHGTGVVYRGEVQNAKEMIKKLSVGEPIHAKVVIVDNDDGYVELSLSEANKQKAWVEVAELSERGEIVKVKVTGVNRGGVIADLLGLPAFLPLSQLSSERYPNITEGDDRAALTKALEALVGVEISVKIIDVNSRNRKLIVSERDAIEPSAQEFVKNYTTGQTIEGIVSGVADFGVFIRFTDNPSVEGMAHISEIDHRIIEHPKEVVKIDDVVSAQITEIKDGRISLSLKALKIDPWTTIGDQYREGQVVTGTVQSTNQFGALVNFGNVQGQVHVSIFGDVDEMKKSLIVGTEHQFVIDRVEPELRRITLRPSK